MVKPNEMPISKKAFGNAVMPCIGDVVEGCKVMYVKSCDFKFTAQGQILPEIGKSLEHGGKKYVVSYVDPDKNRFSANFTGFKDFTVPAPVEQEEEMVKLI